MRYHYGQHQWHSEYIALCKKRDSASLSYIATDCWDAIHANPENPKRDQYWDEYWYCKDELRRRAS